VKSSVLSSSVWLVGIGATAVVLIGAFAHFDPSAAAKPGAIPSSVAFRAEAVAEPTLPADLSPGLAEIIRLAQAHVDEAVILSFIQNSGQVYAPSAEEILYLSDLGLPQNVIAALFKDKPSPTTSRAPLISAAAPSTGPGPEPSPSPASGPDSSFFYNDLAPYGTWVQAPDYGLSWQPTVETIDGDWSPYLDHGQWMDSDSGWYWQSDYSWGWAAFHYGRWVREPRLGWVWVPDNVWAPAWVAWRSSGSYYGWVPLPPGGGALGAGIIVPPSSFVFVSAENFLSRRLRGKIAPAARVANLFAQSAPVGDYRLVNDKIINGGISREAVVAATGKNTKPVTLRSVSSPTAVVADRATLAVYRPDPSAPAAEGPPQSRAFQLSKPAVQPADTEGGQGLTMDASAEESAPIPAFPGSGAPAVELPPLCYAGAAPAPVKSFAAAVNPDGASAPRPIHHHRPIHQDGMERVMPAPPGINGDGATVTDLRRAVELAPPRAMPTETARTTAQPASPSPSGASSSSSRR
jgi:hypothetical protein